LRPGLVLRGAMLTFFYGPQRYHTLITTFLFTGQPVDTIHSSWNFNCLIMHIVFVIIWFQQNRILDFFFFFWLLCLDTLLYIGIVYYLLIKKITRRFFSDRFDTVTNVIVVNKTKRLLSFSSWAILYFARVISFYFAVL